MSSTFATTLFASADEGGGGSILSFLFLPLLLVGMYFLMIRPQRKRMRDQQALQSSIEVGQNVVTTSGIFGTIIEENGPNRFFIEIDDGVQVLVARAAIQGTVDFDAEEAAAMEDGADDDDDADDTAGDVDASAEADASSDD